MPTTVPSAMPSTAPVTDITMIDVAPDITRLSRSRPNWSVPSQKSADGPAKRLISRVASST